MKLRRSRYGSSTPRCQISGANGCATRSSNTPLSIPIVRATANSFDRALAMVRSSLIVTLLGGCFACAMFVRLAPSQSNSVKRSNILVYDLHTKSTHAVYSAEKLIEAPNWSPDGKSLLVNTDGDLYRLPMNARDAKLEKINLLGFAKCNNDKGFSPDGKLVALSSSQNARGSQVYTVAASGGVPSRIVEETPSYFHGFSPDGKWMAIVAQRENNFDLFRVPTGGGAQQRLTSNSGYDDGPDYSPDGKWIYFNSNRSGSWDIWRMPADGAGANDGAAQRVTEDDGEDWFPHCSPDGKWLVFLTFPKGTSTHNDRLTVQLRMVALPSSSTKLRHSTIRTLQQFEGGQGTINVNSWAPDSHRFAYVQYEQ